MNARIGVSGMLVVVVVAAEPGAESPVVVRTRDQTDVVATVVAEASAVSRGSANCGSAVLMVNGSSGSSLFAQPKASEPVTCVRLASFA